MAITAALVKELRECTGAGMMDCKRALTETGGDMESAVELLRKKGAASAEKKAGRIAAEGIIGQIVANNERKGVIVEVNCETDFVTKDESFRKFVDDIAACVLENSPIDIDALLAMTLADGTVVEQARQALIGKIGENVTVRRFALVEPAEGQVSGYVHGNRIGVLTVVTGAVEGPLGRDIAMHVAASRPMCVDETQIPVEVLTKEREIFAAQAANSGKSDNIVEKIIEGRMQKFVKDNTLLGQPFVKDPDITVAELLGRHSAAVKFMARFEVGEGLEKRTDNFVAEVMAQAQTG